MGKYTAPVVDWDDVRESLRELHRFGYPEVTIGLLEPSGQRAVNYVEVKLYMTVLGVESVVYHEREPMAPRKPEHAAGAVLRACQRVLNRIYETRADEGSRLLSWELSAAEFNAAFKR
jgi:hypothetical protein